MANTTKFGTKEEYNEKDLLLQEVRDLQREFKKDSTNIPSTRAKGLMLRQNATSSGCADPVVETEIDNSNFYDTGPSHTHTRNGQNSHQLVNSELIYLEHRNIAEDEPKKQQLTLEERKLQLEERKVALEERKIAHEEKKLQFEKQERLERLQMEKEMHQKLLEQQKQILSLVVKILEKQ